MAPWIVKSITAGGREYVDAALPLGDRNLDDLVLTMTDAGATLDGTVRDSQGTPAAPAAVIVFSAKRADWSNYGFTPDRIVSSLVSSAGLYHFRDVPAGDYYVVAVSDAQVRAWQDPAFLERAARVATPVTFTWGASQTVNLTKVNVQ
jgi:hypothetical protein